MRKGKKEPARLPSGRTPQPQASAPLASARMQAVQTDPQGSWTGVPDDPSAMPVQDADDL